MCVRQAPSLYMIHSSKIKEKQQLEREVHKRTLEREREATGYCPFCLCSFLEISVTQTILKDKTAIIVVL